MDARQKNQLDHNAAPAHGGAMRAVLVLLAASCAPAASTATPAAAGYRSPEAAVQAYFAGSDRCSSELLRTAFHPAAHLVRVDDAGALQSKSQLRWWQSTDAQQPCVPALERQLAVLDREGPMALVETHARYATHRFRDLMLAVETPRGWLVVDKVYDMLRPDQAPAPWTDDAGVRQVLDEKIRAAHENDPMLLASTHLEDCVYSAVRAGSVPYARDSVSEWGARYAERRARGEDGRAARWRILQVGAAGRLAFAKLEVISSGKRYIDHIALLRIKEQWLIAAAVWGDPS